jgi:hypothetical protein
MEKSNRYCQKRQRADGCDWICGDSSVSARYKRVGVILYSLREMAGTFKHDSSSLNKRVMFDFNVCAGTQYLQTQSNLEADDL